MSMQNQQQPFLTFNVNLLGAGSFENVPGYPEEESQEDQKLLWQPVPLKSSWVLWEQLSGTTWSTKKVVTFNTAQEFWRIWNGVPQPSELLDNKRYFRENQGGGSQAIDAIMLFRDGISPEWEDAANSQGGHFQILLKPTAGGAQIDEYWNNLVLGMVGETMEGADEITGVRLVDKLSQKTKVTDCIRLELWYHSKASNSAVGMLRRSMEKCLTMRLDGTQGTAFKGEAIQDKKHNGK
uniref:eIF4E-1b n=1 Tax=Amphidinium carterae TaxID=2961 RepID=A0A0X9WB83_AMPCA|nr:eIF4E-1b [Amphidinium carterae]|mmetsp:Transcript_11155/g.25339  ORF Transcript_11155/g.25339 Transcript_11155/m.25339 type:complete len:238 (-) Transcript_11155:65-778(-)